MGKEFNLEKMIFSVLVVRPREAFFDWLKPVIQRQNWKLDEIYHPEEDSIWLIPAAGTFSSSDEIDKYITNLKPAILKHELGRFGPLPEEFPAPLSADVCDKFFVVELRDRAFRASSND